MIAPRVLSRELKALAQSGLIVRKDYGVVPPKVEYRLTDWGQAMCPALDNLLEWAAAKPVPPLPPRSERGEVG